MKLREILRYNGIESRRKADALIKGGFVSVDGQMAEIGMEIQQGQKIVVEDQDFAYAWPYNLSSRVLLYNKPEGEVCSRKSDDRANIYTNLPDLDFGQWISCGRLDQNTRGLVILTNNGDISYALSHPSSCIDREYLVKIEGTVSIAALRKVLTGVMMEEGQKVCFEDMRFHASKSDKRHKSFSVTVMSGQYKVVRRLWESIGCRVVRLVKIRHGAVPLPKGLKVGSYSEISAKELMVLESYLGDVAARRNVLKQREVTRKDRLQDTLGTLRDQMASLNISARASQRGINSQKG